MKQCKHCGDAIEVQGLQCNTCRNGLQRYGLNKNDMIALHESQDCKCKLCGKETLLFTRRLNNSAHIDHDHATGKVRSILCHPCNASIGYIENNLDPVDILQYLTN